MFTSFKFQFISPGLPPRPPLTDGSLSLAGPASLSGGSAPGLPFPETSPPGQPPPPFPLGVPLPPLLLLLPQVERGHKKEVHLPAAGTPGDHPGGGGAGVRPSSTSSLPPPPQRERPSTSEPPFRLHPLGVTRFEGGGREGDTPSSTSWPSRNQNFFFFRRTWNVL